MELPSLDLKQMTYQPNSSLYYLSTFFFITILCVLKLTKKNKSINNNLPPSPPKLPIIGNLHQLGKLPHRSLTTLSKKNGPIMFLQLGQTPALVVSSAEIAKEITKSHDISFSNRPHLKAARMFFYDFMDMGFAPYGEDWRNRRKICVHELLSPSRVRSFQPMREKEVAILIDSIHEECMRGSCVNLSQMLIATANNIVSRCILGMKGYESRVGRRRSLEDIGRKMVVQLAAFSFGNYFPSLLDWADVLTGLMSELKETFCVLDEFLEEVIEEHKRRRNKINDEDSGESDENFVDMLLQLQENGDMVEFGLTGVHLVKGLLVDMFMGGSETTSTTLEWTFAELIKNPKIMKKVQEEVRRVVGHKTKIDENDVNQMSYLKCVIKETLRLHPPAPLSVPRQTTSSVKINGYHIPPKTTVYMNLWAIQRDPELWDNAEEFIPERFESSQIDFKGQDFQLIPFGSGRRGCPGISFGVAAVDYVLANILYWFDWKIPMDQSIDMSEMNGLAVTKKVPLHLEPIPYSKF